MFVIDLENAQVDIYEPWIDEANRFLEENHPEAEKLDIEELDEWDFGSARRKMAEYRGWPEDEGEQINLMLFGEDSERYGGAEVYGGFHPMMEDIWREDSDKMEFIHPETGKYLGKLKEEFPDEQIDIITSRQNVTDELESYLEEHGILEEVDGFYVTSDVVESAMKTDIEGKKIFFDDNPDMVPDLSSGQYQVLPVTGPNSGKDFPAYQEWDGDLDSLDNNAVYVDDIEDGYHAMTDIGNQL